MSSDLQHATHTTPAFRFKGGLFTLTTLQVFTNDLKELKTQLVEQVQQAPNFFKDAPVIIDLRPINIAKKDINLISLKKTLQSCQLMPIAIKNANEEQQAAAKNAEIASLSVQSKSEELTPEPDLIKSESYTEEPSTPQAYQSKLITTPIRSGQQVYAPHGDLVILAPVGHGAEILASGHIHVYGPLRGRALAGVNGNTEARIFCQSLEAELVSIAGHYMASEDIENIAWKVPAEISAKEEHLHIRPL